MLLICFVSCLTLQLQMFCRKLAPRGDYVDWRAMLISLLQIPSASLQTLLDVQEQYRALPTPRENYITLQQYNEVCWLQRNFALPFVFYVFCFGCFHQSNYLIARNNAK